MFEMHLILVSVAPEKKCTQFFQIRFKYFTLHTQENKTIYEKMVHSCSALHRSSGTATAVVNKP